MSRRHTPSDSQKRSRRKKLRFQALESRQLLAGDVVSASPWTNPIDPMDVNMDGETTARDALAIINQIARSGSTSELTVAPPILDADSMFYDTTGDRELTALDALRVINSLARNEHAARAEGEDTQSTIANPKTADLVFTQDYARTTGTVDASSPEQSFRFVADRDNVAIDLSSLANEALAELRVFDELGVELTTELLSEHRSRFEGVKFPTSAGRVYTIVTTLDTELAGQFDVDAFDYTLDVLQFDLGEFPGVVVSDDPGLAWANAFGPDSPLGSDVHGDSADDATSLRPFEREADFQSNIDTSDDVDWFRISNVSNAITVSISGSSDASFHLEVYDDSLNFIEPTNSFVRDGRAVVGTYAIDRLGEAFVRVASAGGAIGEYRFHLSDNGFTPVNPRIEPLGFVDEVGNTIEDASDLAIGSGGQSFDQRLESGEDVDVYRIPNALPGSIIVTGVPGIRFDLLTQAGEVIQRADPEFRGTGPIDLAYYSQLKDTEFVFLKVGSSVNAIGRYSVMIGMNGESPADLGDFLPIDTNSVTDQPDSQLGDDLHGATTDDATSLRRSLPGTFVSNLDTSTDVDTFAISGYQGEVSLSMSVHTEDAIGINLVATDYYGNVLEPDRYYRDGTSVGIYFDRENVGAYTDRFGVAKSRIFVSISSDSGSTGTYKLMGGIPRPWYQTSDAIFGIDAHGGALASSTDLGDLAPFDSIYSYLDGPADRDAFRFTAAFPETSISLRRSEALAFQRQGTIHLYDIDGTRIKPAAVDEPKDDALSSTYGSIEKAYDLTAGQEYYVVVSNEAEQKFGSYGLTLRSSGNFLSYLDTSNPEVVEIPAGSSADVSFNGSIDTTGEVKFYQFSTSAREVRFSQPDSHMALGSNESEQSPVRYELFDLDDGSTIGRVLGGSPLPVYLPAAMRNETGNYLLAVWVPRSTGNFELTAGFRGAATTGLDHVSDTFADAQQIDLNHFVTVPSPTQGGAATRLRQLTLEVDLNDGNDVDVYQFDAVDSTVRVTHMMFGTPLFLGNLLNSGTEFVKIQLFDAEDNEISGVVNVDAESERVTLERTTVDFSTVVGERYFLRFSQSTTNPLLTRMILQ